MKVVRIALLPGWTALWILLAGAGSAPAVTMDWVVVGTPGNASDTLSNCYGASCGSVGYTYAISKYEVTNAQYAEFLNAKAAADPLGLFSTSMGISSHGGITRSGDSGSYTYAVKAGFEDKPVNYVSFYDALRFTNWLHNGQGGGDTEMGAYTLQGGTETPGNWATITRSVGADVFLPSENEWYKAAYSSPGGTFFDYPTGTDSVIGCVLPGADAGNAANCGGIVGSVTAVGAYALSDSPFGTFDQGGNVDEWIELMDGPNGGVRGGAFDSTPSELGTSNYYRFDPAEGSSNRVGFRVASVVVPEPATGLLVVAGVLGLAAARKRSV